MSTVIYTRGVQASGKTTWAKAWVAEDRATRRRVNRDDIRHLLGIGGVGSHAEEQRVTEYQRKMIADFISDGKDIVIDDTNLRAKFLKESMRFVKSLGAGILFQDFPIDLDTAVYRDTQRAYRGERSVGDDVIITFYQKFTPKGVLPPVPTLDDVQPVPTNKYTEQPGLASCILVDVDGTLAHHVNRSPYDTSLYHMDEFDRVIAQVARAYENATACSVFIMSGRDEDFKDVTVQWLKKFGFEFDDIFMRPSGDKRNDAVVKSELFDHHILGKFNVDFILDDRDRVVRAWRDKGLRVLQVADGAF